MSEYFLYLKSEWLATLIIFLLLFIKIGKGMSNGMLLSIVQVLLLLSAITGFFFNGRATLFDGMFQTDPSIAFQKNILTVGVYLMTLLFSDWLKKNQNLAEYLILMLSALLGMYFMISSGNLLMFYLSLELSSIPVAAMANFDLDRKASSEAAMKLILSSAFSSGVLLFGISIVYGVTGTIAFSHLALYTTQSPLLWVGFIFLFTGFAFKLSIVPFHLWTADVYEGAPVPTSSFLSAISKGSIAFIFTLTLYRVFGSLEAVWHEMLVVLSVATMVVGNLFAMRQQNMKRFLAFSSIAQVGFILVGMSGHSPAGNAAVIYFILIYIFSNLAAFGIVSVISERTGKERIDDYRGLYQTNPFLSWIMALALFSLAGIPPTAGFFGKLFLLTAGASAGNYWFIAIAALNMIVSLYYYLKVVRSIFMEHNDQPMEKIQTNPSSALGLTICAVAILLVGLMSWIYGYIDSLQ
jgi:NADH-quinone oxidoreductase subunit N